jgi:hypothetical protein
MKKTTQIGLGNTIAEKTEILHTGIIGRNAFGRISDLLAAWCDKKSDLSEKRVADVRLMVQALLEFAHPKANSALGQFEFTIEEDEILTSVRFENHIFVETDSVERTLSQYWLNSEESSLLKKILYPQDRVEVRFNQKVNLIEWRVCRSLKPEAVSHNDASFLVLLDESTAIASENRNYTDLGDLPYQEWLNSIYKNESTENRSGEFFVEGESLQNESEWARVVSTRESEQIESETRIERSKIIDEDTKVVFRELAQEDTDQINDRSRRYVEELHTKLLAEQTEIKDNVREVLSTAKMRELRAIREMELLEQKVRQFEKLLLRKELVVQKNQSEIRLLNQQLTDKVKTKAVKLAEAQGQAFKEKAIQMFEQLKQTKEQSQELEKLVIELQHREKALTVGKDVSGGTSTQVEELNKKLERQQRQLENEKLKVKALSERVTGAEREAQAAAPLVDDLERKVENALKLAQQHKTETDQMKMKLVQAAGEKNKVANELMKAQAQIQTLMKRHAS